MKLIHQLSKETGITIPTLRFYEKSGLIQGKRKTDVSTNNYQFYEQEAIDKLNFIQMAKAVGFTLSEIKDVVDLWYKKEITQQAQLTVLDKRLAQIDEKVTELETMKKQIKKCKENIINHLSFNP